MTCGQEERGLKIEWVNFGDQAARHLSCTMGGQVVTRSRRGKRKKKNKSKTSIQTLGEQGDPRTLGCLQPMLAPRTRGRTRNSIDESRQAELLVSDLSGIWNVLRLAECKHERRNRYRGQFGKGVDKRRGIVLGLTSILAEGSLFTCERRARTPKQTPSDWVVPLVPRPS